MLQDVSGVGDVLLVMVNYYEIVLKFRRARNLRKNFQDKVN